MNFKLSKLRDFKNIEGSYAFVNPPVSTTFNLANVVFDVKFNELKPTLMISLNKEIEVFLDLLKSEVVEEVYRRKIYNMSKEDLSNLYVNPIKTVKQGKKIVEAVKFKITDTTINKLLRKTKVGIDVSISSMWFNQTSFGVYLNVGKIEISEIRKKCHILESDNESEIDLKI
jgi:hypothetical protein